MFQFPHANWLQMYGEKSCKYAVEDPKNLTFALPQLSVLSKKVYYFKSFIHNNVRYKV
jgi:hypothetical protein